MTYKFHDPVLAEMAAVAEELGSEMKGPARAARRLGAAQQGIRRGSPAHVGAQRMGRNLGQLNSQLRGNPNAVRIIQQLTRYGAGQGPRPRIPRVAGTAPRRYARAPGAAVRTPRRGR
jgi:hypothetical protein